MNSRIAQPSKGRSAAEVPAGGRKDFVRRAAHVWRVCMHRMWVNNVTAMSAALSFRTIFALVPILVLGFLMLKSVNTLDQSKTQFRQFVVNWIFKHITIEEEAELPVDVPPLLAAPPLEQDGPPAPPPVAEHRVIKNVADELTRIVNMVESKLTVGLVGPVGVVLLAWAAMSLINTVEHSLNRIFAARQTRSLGRRVMMYWSALTLGPLLLVVATFGGQKALALSERIIGGAWLLAILGWAGPLIVGLLVLAALYKFMPNTHVSTRGALIGALAALPVWLVAKWGFDLYVREVVGNQSLYGTLGLLPLFLIWLDFSWLIFLGGAETAHVIGNLRRIQSAQLAENVVLGPTDSLAAALAVARSFASGRGPVSLDDIEAAVRLPQECVVSLVDRLRDNGVVCAVDNPDDPRFVLARPADKITVLEVMELCPSNDATPTKNRYTPEIHSSVTALRQRADAALGQATLADLLDGKTP